MRFNSSRLLFLVLEFYNRKINRKIYVFFNYDCLLSLITIIIYNESRYSIKSNEIRSSKFQGHDRSADRSKGEDPV